MAGNSSKKTASPLPIIAILVVLLGAAIVTRSPLESTRPKAPIDLRHAVREEDKIEARLWQDPLKVALDHVSSMHAEAEDINTRPLCPSKHAVNDVREQINNLYEGGKGDNAIVHVLLVMIRGGVTAEDHERRLRNRYAIHTALHSSDLVSEDTKHIQYFKLPWTEKQNLEKGIEDGNVPRILKCDNESSNPLVVPFEWFRRGKLSYLTKERWFDQGRPENVLVVWLAESAFLDHPLTRLSQVIDALGVTRDYDMKLDVIGPSHSGTLRTMLGETGPIYDSKEKFNDANFVEVNSILKAHSEMLKTMLSKVEEIYDSNDDANGPNFVDVNSILKALSEMLKAIFSKVEEIYDSNDDANGPDFVDVNSILKAHSEILKTHSEMLKAMLIKVEEIYDSNDDANEPNFVDVNSILDGLKIYSPWSTVSPPLLVEDRHVQDPNRNSITEMYSVIPEKFERIGIKFYRMIGTDDLLAMQLIQELRRRGVDVIPKTRGGKGHNVALISEWDTFYGKAFPLTFATMMESIDPNSPNKEPNWYRYARKLKQKDNISREERVKKNLHIFGYFQGIDGRLPESESSTGQTSNEKGEFKLTLTKSPECPVGRSQLDYIRQLARKLDDEYEVKAFGVVGTDIYDKQLLIHALREELGDVIVFTLDLDTRMMHSGQCKWTRNVIVASHYGLELKRKLQFSLYDYAGRSAPPFRDNYQTSLYFTCRNALNLWPRYVDTTPYIDEGRSMEFITHPRLFEIGRECAVNLSVDDADIHPLRRIHPKKLRKIILLIVSIIVLSVLLLVQFSSRVQKVVALISSKKQENVDVIAKVLKVSVPILILTVILFVGVVIYEHYHTPTGEPFSLFEGVSIWPGEALRLLVVILSLCFMMKSVHDLKVNEIELCRWFNSKRPVNFRKFAISSQRESFKLRSGGERKRRVHSKGLWKGYLHKGAFHRRVYRSLFMTLTYGLSVIALMLILGLPNTPYRGKISFCVDKILLIFSVFSMVFLIFFVLDAIQQSRKFMRDLKEYMTKWPKRIVRRFKGTEADSLKKVKSLKKAKSLKKTNALKETDGFSEWLDIKFIAFHTDPVCKLIYYPFIVLLFMLLARNWYFDNWDFRISLIIVFLLNVAYALVSAILLRRMAEQSRSVAIDRLQEKLVKAAGAGLEERTKQLETMIEEIKSLRKGAFSSFLENPVVHVLLGSGGAGLIALLRYIPL